MKQLHYQISNLYYDIAYKDISFNKINGTHLVDAYLNDDFVYQNVSETLKRRTLSSHSWVYERKHYQ